MRTVDPAQTLKLRGCVKHVRDLVSASYLHQRARLDSREAVQHVRYQRLERLECVVVRDQDDDGQRQSTKILLVLEVLIGGQEYIEVVGGDT